MLNSPFKPVLGNPVVRKSSAPQNPIQQEKRPPNILSYYADLGGCGFWRIGWPEYVLNINNLASCHSQTRMITDPNFYKDIEVVRIQRQAAPHQRDFVKYLKSLQPKFNFKLIYEVDDVTIYEDIPSYNAFKEKFKPQEIQDSIKEMMNICDEVTVPTHYMKSLFEQKWNCNHITVIPNFPPKFWIGNFYNPSQISKNYDNNKKKPRILYAGSGCHFDHHNLNNGKDDFSNIIDFIRKTVNQYQWVFFGGFPLPLKDLVLDKKIEFHKWTNLIDYPYKLHSLNVQLTIAPLDDNNFNRAKSNIKLLEASALGLPCVCQDMITYADAPHKFKNVDELEQQIKDLLNPHRYKNNIQKNRKIVESKFLESPENYGCHVEVLTTPYQSDQRIHLKKYNV